MKCLVALALLVTPVLAQPGGFDVVSIKPGDRFPNGSASGSRPAEALKRLAG